MECPISVIFFQSISCLADVCKNFDFVEGVKITFSAWAGWCSTPTSLTQVALMRGEAAVLCLALRIKPTSLGASHLFSI